MDQSPNPGVTGKPRKPTCRCDMHRLKGLAAPLDTEADGIDGTMRARNGIGYRLFIMDIRADG